MDFVGGEVKFLFTVLGIVFKRFSCLCYMSCLVFIALEELNSYATWEEALEEGD